MGLDSPGTEVSAETVASTTQGPPPHNLTLSSSAGLELWTGWARKSPYSGASYWHWQDGESINADARQVNAIEVFTAVSVRITDWIWCHVIWQINIIMLWEDSGRLLHCYQSRKFTIWNDSNIFIQVMLSMWLLIVERMYFIISSENSTVKLQFVFLTRVLEREVV